jgi:hypothetical protein
MVAYNFPHRDGMETKQGQLQPERKYRELQVEEPDK